MYRTASSFLASAIALAFVAAADAGEVRRYRFVSSDESRVPATIVWENREGLGPVSGKIHLADGPLAFTGENPEPGLLRLRTDDGTAYEFWKKRTESGSVWIGRARNAPFTEEIFLEPVHPEPETAIVVVGFEPAPFPRESRGSGSDG